MSTNTHPGPTVTQNDANSIGGEMNNVLREVELKPVT